MNEIIEFEGKQVRMVGTLEKPEWVAKDVCDVLGLDNPSKALLDFPDDEKGITSGNTPGGNQSLLTVTEPGLYHLIFRSKKPDAERFQRWVFHEVLPQIRRTGRYASPAEDPIIAQMTALIEVRKAQLQLEAKTEEAANKAMLAHRTALAVLDTVQDNYHHYSVLGFCNLINKNVTAKEAAKHGIAISKICRSEKKTIHKIKDTRFGEVNSYPQDVLEKYFGEKLKMF